MEMQSLFSVLKFTCDDDEPECVGILMHHREAGQCQNFLDNYFARAGYFIRRCSNCVEAYRYPHEHWREKLQIICTNVRLDEQSNFFYTVAEIEAMKKR